MKMTVSRWTPAGLAACSPFVATHADAADDADSASVLALLGDDAFAVIPLDVAVRKALAWAVPRVLAPAA